MGIDSKQLRELIVRPALKEIDLWSEAAENLLMGTAAVESSMGRFLRQTPTGPARGIYQMEEATFKDLTNYLLNRRSDLMVKICFTWNYKKWPKFESIIWDLKFATAMARIRYIVVPDPLPEDYVNTAHLGEYWDQFYNRNPYDGTVADFIKRYNLYV